MEQRLLQRSLQDDAFRRRLLEDPNTAVDEELGTRLPEGVEVRAVEEIPDTIYLVLPPTSSSGQPDAELYDRELESVAGGGWGARTYLRYLSRRKYLHGPLLGVPKIRRLRDALGA